MPELPADDHAPAGSASLIDQILREGARNMLAAALQAEVDAYIAAFADERDAAGRRLVVRNGYHAPRELLTGIGGIEVKAPRVNDKRIDEETGERKRFSSAILPAWARKTPQLSEVLPLLYLHGLSTGDFVPALGQFLGSTAGLSASVITKLTEQWKGEQRAFAERDLSAVDYVYLWVDGIHVNIRLEEHKLCLLVMIGVRADGRKELVALSDGYRESTESWADLLRDAKRRGMRAPVLAVGDGALGFWSALAEVFPQTRGQRCWFHKIANVLGAMPKSAHPAAKKHLAEIWNAEDRDHAERAVKDFQAAYGAKYPKAVAKVIDDLDELLAFYDYPAEHWVHLRTTNPIESTFATVRHRTKVTKGPGSRAAGLAMAFKLIESAQKRWRAVNAPHLVALVRAGARFVKGRLVEREHVAAA
ncbi:IS256 family transposase [Thermocatellispora tengchongensis]|uniref:IS256 family transposase n=1 Tax=Thermocatellispora tengchongensis TaxID=1073253 RepID=UPI00161DB567|nr:IS256 family transposase [Thermocatellispora tengchongensis]